jgi:hypothetical protein
MTADEISCPGSDGNQDSMLPEMSAKNGKGWFGLETLQNIQDSSDALRVGAAE